MYSGLESLANLADNSPSSFLKSKELEYRKNTAWTDKRYNNGFKMKSLEE